jgi:hypothetical protein
MKYSSSFTYDLHLGEQAETWAKELFGSCKVEVKNDSMAHKTGNMFIEVYSRNKPSGISTTEADYWLYKINDSAIIISTPKLKELVRKFYRENGFTKGGDSDTSLGVLVPLIYLLT